MTSAPFPGDAGAALAGLAGAVLWRGEPELPFWLAGLFGLLGTAAFALTAARPDRPSKPDEPGSRTG